MYKMRIKTLKEELVSEQPQTLKAKSMEGEDKKKTVFSKIKKKKRSDKMSAPWEVARIDSLNITKRKEIWRKRRGNRKEGKKKKLKHPEKKSSA